MLRSRFRLALLLGVFLFLFDGPVDGQSPTGPEVSNVRATQLPDRTVEVLYDLSGAPAKGATVTIRFSEDGGATYGIGADPAAMTGDVGSEIPNGEDRRILWDPASAFPAEFFEPTMRAAVSAMEEITILLPGDVPLVMVRIPSGTFQMGSPETERGRDSDETLHEVTLTTDYYLGKTEVTQLQWEAVKGPKPYGCVPSFIIALDGDQRSVVCVSWDDVSGSSDSFIKTLNSIQGTTAFRLPTEAEWERAARGDTTTRFSHGDALECDDECASCPAHGTFMWWCGSDSGEDYGGPKVVGQRFPNAYGLLDMHGNVREWVWDRQGSYPSSPVTDPTGPSSGSVNRETRGGSWVRYAAECRSADRSPFRAEQTYETVGFRLAMSAEGTSTGDNIAYSNLFTISLKSCVGPTIKAQPQSTSIVRGQSTALSVSAVASEGALTYQWYAGMSGDTSQAIAGATESSVDVSPSETASYWVRVSDGCRSIDSEAATVTVTDPVPLVVVSALPGALLQPEGVGGATTSLTLTNAGDLSTMVNVSADGQFFTISPATFSLGPKISQQVVVTGEGMAAGEYSGAVVPSGAGVPAGLSIPVRMLVAAPPPDPVQAVPDTNRIDVAGPPDAVRVPSEIGYTNTGEGTLTGLVVSDVPWLEIQEPVITIDPGERATIEFDINREQRADAEAPIGSVAGTLSLQYLSGAGQQALKTLIDKRDGGFPLSTTLVIVTDTAKPQTTTAAPLPLESGEIALFLAGVGHAQSSVGTFISDLYLSSLRLLTDLALYYTRAGESTANSLTTTLSTLASTQPLNFADVTRTVFDQESGLGTLQIRGEDADALIVGASVFNKSNPAGTYGSAIPVLRSDRSIGEGERMFISGLVGSSANGRTNLIVQETTGRDAWVRIHLLDADGSVVKEQFSSVPAFQHLRMNDFAPSGAVSAVITAEEGYEGKVLGFATPVDRGGDTWVVTDWPRVNGYDPSEKQVVPVVGRVLGRNDNFFRTSLSVMNEGGTDATVAVRFVTNGVEPVSREVTLGPLSTATWDDVMEELFDLDSGVGFIEIDPADSAVSVTSRTFATIGEDPRQFGTGVPTVASNAMNLGEMKRISGFDDASQETIDAAMPATFRTNLGLVETTGKPVLVRVTLHFRHAVGNGLTAIGSGSREWYLEGHGFALLSNIAMQVLGENRSLLKGNLKDLFAEIEIVGGEGSVIGFTSSVDNGTADQLFKLQ